MFKNIERKQKIIDAKHKASEKQPQDKDESFFFQKHTNLIFTQTFMKQLSPDISRMPPSYLRQCNIEKLIEKYIEEDSKSRLAESQCREIEATFLEEPKPVIKMDKIAELLLSKKNCSGRKSTEFKTNFLANTNVKNICKIIPSALPVSNPFSIPPATIAIPRRTTGAKNLKLQAPPRRASEDFRSKRTLKIPDTALMIKPQRPTMNRDSEVPLTCRAGKFCRFASEVRVEGFESTRSVTQASRKEKRIQRPSFAPGNLLKSIGDTNTGINIQEFGRAKLVSKSPLAHSRSRQNIPSGKNMQNLLATSPSCQHIRSQSTVNIRRNKNNLCKRNAPDYTNPKNNIKRIVSPYSLPPRQFFLK